MIQFINDILRLLSAVESPLSYTQKERCCLAIDKDPATISTELMIVLSEYDDEPDPFVVRTIQLTIARICNEK